MGYLLHLPILHVSKSEAKTGLHYEKDEKRELRKWMLFSQQTSHS